MVNLPTLLLGAGRNIFLIGISTYVAATLAVAQAGGSPGAAAAADRDAEVRADLAFDVVSIRPSDAGSDPAAPAGRAGR